MVRAELIITIGGWSHQSTSHCVKFDSVETAKAEYDRIAALLKKRADKGNDVPKFLDVKGINELTCDFDQVNAVGMSDLRIADDNEIGLRDEFPHLTFRPL